MARPRRRPAPEGADLEVGGRIRAERLRLGLTQERMAARLGIGRPTYRNVEDTPNPGYATLVRLVELGGMCPRALCPEMFGRRSAGRDELAPSGPA